MSRTNCFLPNSGFVLNFRVRMVNSLMAASRRAHGVVGRGEACARKGSPLARPRAL